MDILSYVIGKSAGEAAAHVDIEQLDVTENNTYTAQSGHAYSPVVVNVPQTTVEALNVTSDGTYTAPEGKAYSPISVSVSDFDLPSFLEGSMTSIESGVTSIRGYAFYNYGSLQSASFPNATSLGAYAFSGCNSLTSLSIPSVRSVGSYCFSASKITSFESLDCTSIGSYAFTNVQTLNTVNIVLNGNLGEYAFNSARVNSVHLKINGQIGNSAFNSQHYVNDFQLDPTSNVTKLGTSAFQYMGYQRTSPSTKVFTFDFRNSTFTEVPTDCFRNNQYYITYFPSTVSTINTRAFSAYQNSLVYFSTEVPPVAASSNCFEYWTDSKMLVPYGVVNRYKTTTNYTSVSSNILGYAPASTFTEGEQLPLYDNDGYTLTWYSDVALTTVITDCPVGSPELYCTSGSKTACAVNGLVDANTTFSIVDTEGDTYNTLPTFIPIGRGITINATPPTDGTNATRVNGTVVTTPYTIATLGTDITIQSKSVEGTITQDTFENSSWDTIKKVGYLGIADQYWNVGDTKNITLTNSANYTVRIANSSGSLYDYSNEIGSTGFVIEFVDLYTTASKMFDINSSTGGWKECLVRKNAIPSVYNLLPSDMQNAISSVKVLASSGGSGGATLQYTDDTLFLPAEREILSTRGYSWTTEWAALTRWQYYAQHSTAADFKKVVAGTSTYTRYWTRSAVNSTSANFTIITESGNSSNTMCGSSLNFPICFCI